MHCFFKLFGKHQDSTKKFSQLRDHSYITNVEFEGG